MRQRLIWKVMALNFPAIGLVIGVIWLSIEYLAADYFTELMEQYSIAPNDIHNMFLDSVHQYLAWASIVAILLAVVVSYLLSSRVLRPLQEVSTAIDKMRAGDRDVRARALSNDELGDLANAFNMMSSQVNQVEKLRENMVVDLAHELRTPVTNIRGYAEGLRDQVIEPSEQNLAVLEKEALRLGDLVESLLDLSRADAAEFTLNVQCVDVQDCISTALEAHADELREKELEVEVLVPTNANNIEADKENLNIILSIFVQNACQYSPVGSELKIWCYQNDGGIKINMSNNSETISSADLQLIFERFYRTEKSRSRNSGGAGIGLAIVKKLVEAHGGMTGATSEQGVFTIWCSLPSPVKS